MPQSACVREKKRLTIIVFRSLKKRLSFCQSIKNFQDSEFDLKWKTYNQIHNDHTSLHCITLEVIVMLLPVLHPHTGSRLSRRCLFSWQACSSGVPRHRQHCHKTAGRIMDTCPFDNKTVNGYPPSPAFIISWSYLRTYQSVGTAPQWQSTSHLWRRIYKNQERTWSCWCLTGVTTSGDKSMILLLELLVEVC